MPETNILIYLVRKDLRVSDNPILHNLSKSHNHHGFTHLLPVFVFPAHQMEVSGFVRPGSHSPYPEARSAVGGFWRCGPHRARFIGEAVWDLKNSLEAIGSTLLLRVGSLRDETARLVSGLHEKKFKVGAVWMTAEHGDEEVRDERAVADVCAENDVHFEAWADEKYFIDDQDVKPVDIRQFPDVFTTYRKLMEPLREKPKHVLPTPSKASLPSLPDMSMVPQQVDPFIIPSTAEKLDEALVQPVRVVISSSPDFPADAVSAHPFKGGETAALERVRHLVASGVMTTYKDTRNGLLGKDFSTKLSAYLAQGCLTARQIHCAMVGYEDGTDAAFENVAGFGKGENEGTKAVRFELLWRDYMRLCTKKFQAKLFRLDGFRGESAYPGSDAKSRWKTASITDASPDQQPPPEVIGVILDRFQRGTTGMGLIDASQRELLLTGYTSNRTRQNVASFLTKHLGIDWRYGAEWYEMLLVDYDVSSNWANWQYVAGVGNDPRGEARIFNPVKQAFEYDPEGAYVRTWVPETRKLEILENVFQAWTASAEDLKQAGLEGNPMALHPVKRIDFSVKGNPKKAPSKKNNNHKWRNNHNAWNTHTRPGTSRGPGHVGDFGIPRPPPVTHHTYPSFDYGPSAWNMGPRHGQPVMPHSTGHPGGQMQSYFPQHHQPPPLYPPGGFYHNMHPGAEWRGGVRGYYNGQTPNYGPGRFMGYGGGAGMGASGGPYRGEYAAQGPPYWLPDPCRRDA